MKIGKNNYTFSKKYALEGKFNYIRIIKGKVDGETSAIRDEIERSDVQSLYEDKFGTYLVLLNGRRIKTGHTLKELEGYFNGSV